MAKKRTPHYQRDAYRREGAHLQPSEKIPVDLSKQAANNSYSHPPLFYEDIPFVCAGCGKEEVWTARQQQWWYEVAKGSIYARAIRCLACRRRNRAKRTHESQADKQPIRHIGTLMKLVRAEIEPAILAAGFAFEARNKPRQTRERSWIDYRRNGQLFSFAFEVGLERPARFVAELLEENGACRIVAVTELGKPRDRAEIMATIKVFAAAVTEFIAGLGSTP